MQAAATASDVRERDANQAKANAGDPEAQFKVGDSRCCSVGFEGPVRQSLHDNQKATAWLCLSAVQNYGPAQLELARIYSGRPFRRNVMKKLVSKVAGASTNMPTALMWAKLAAQNNVDGAADLLTTIEAEASPADRAIAGQLASRWKSAPCTWNDAIVSRQARG